MKYIEKSQCPFSRQEACSAFSEGLLSGHNPNMQLFRTAAVTHIKTKAFFIIIFFLNGAPTSEEKKNLSCAQKHLPFTSSHSLYRHSCLQIKQNCFACL